MRLFEIDEDTNEVKLNKPWIQMVPEFAALMSPDRCRGTKGDSDGRNKLRARKELTFIYFMVDFGSPLRDWEEDEKFKESLYYAELTDKDVDATVLKAKSKYEQLFFQAARALRTYKSMQMALDEVDSYFETVNFRDTDKKGELVHSINDLIGAGKKAEEYYVALANMEKRVEEQLTAGAKTIRGTAELGDQETKKGNSWSESDIAENSSRMAGNNIASKNFTDLSSILKQ